MSTPNDGGPVFPIQSYTAPNGVFEWPLPGMSLRDWFAGQALAGLLADHTNMNGPKRDAEASYALADAMLAERNKKNKS